MNYHRLLFIFVLLLGITVMTACRAPSSPLENTQWVLSSYTVDGVKNEVKYDARITAYFDSEDKQVSGNAGCNAYGGPYEIDGLKITATGPFYMTEMSCGEDRDRQESIFIQAIQAVEKFKIDNDNLTIDCGRWTLSFDRE